MRSVSVDVSSGSTNSGSVFVVSDGVTKVAGTFPLLFNVSGIDGVAPPFEASFSGIVRDIQDENNK